MILPRSFFDRPTVDVARDLLGKTLIRRLPDGTRISSPITETEAYDGFDDRASHAHRGRTKRNAVMFGPPGYTYLYLCYGMHWLLNLTTREEGHPAAVLVRGTVAASGPGRVTRHFLLTGEQNILPLRPVSGIWVASQGIDPEPTDILATPRVGVDYAGPEWRTKCWRFVWKHDMVASPNRPNGVGVRN